MNSAEELMNEGYLEAERLMMWTNDVVFTGEGAECGPKVLDSRVSSEVAPYCELSHQAPAQSEGNRIMKLTRDLALRGVT